MAIALTTGPTTTSSAAPRTPPAGSGSPAGTDRAAPDAPEAPKTPKSPKPPKTPKHRTVTLITGDRVLLDRSGEVVGMIRAKGREGVPVQVVRAGGHTHVIPRDALGLIHERRLDRRLFDVTELDREQYRARTGNGVPVIVTYQGTEPAAKAELHAAADPTVRATLRSVNGEALTVPEDTVAAAWTALTRPATEVGRLAAAPGVATVSLDGLHRATLDRSVARIGAPTAWKAGHDGTGVTIAVLDTGIDDTHEDFAGRIVAERNFSAAEDAEDRHGHGTHVASIAAGSGARSGGRHRGVAPGAGLLNAKVLDDDGYGSDSEIIEGMEWAVARGARVVNLSLGDIDTPGIDPMEEAVNRLSKDSGALFVVAAGNAGPDASTVGTPGSADAALTVGAVDGDDGLADFSSVGPRVGDGAVKPDLTAPGVDIGAAAAENSVVQREGTPVADGYVALSGTSMAAPHVAGAAALLAQRHPDWTGERLKGALTSSAVPAKGHTPFRQGTGRVDVAAALRQAVVAEPVSIGFGTARWPHHDDEPITRAVTYRNLGDRAVTLELAATGTDPEGGAAPRGMFTLSAERVTVPAGGTASVRVTADTRLGGDLDGAYGLVITATGGGRTVRTAGAVDREVESYDLTVRAVGRDGGPTGHWEGSLFPHTGDAPVVLRGDDGTATVRMPRGDYTLSGELPVPGRDGGRIDGLDWLVAPAVRLTGNTAITLDARRARPVTMTVPSGRARQTELAVTFDLHTAEGYVGLVNSAPDLPRGFRTARIGPVPKGAEIEAAATTTWVNGSTEYHAAHSRRGSFYTGLTLRTGRSEMARLVVSQAATAPGRTGVLMTTADTAAWASETGHTIPRVSTVYVRTQGTRWSQSFLQTNEAGEWEAEYHGGERSYTAGRSYHHAFNNGVFGPNLRRGEGGVFRDGDFLYGSVNPLSDGAGHLGGSDHDRATTTLYRNGGKYATRNEILDHTEFTLPKGKATYRLVTTVERSGPSKLSRRVSAAYTFTSGRTSEETAIPVSAVRFAPKLRLDGTSRARATVSVPVVVQGAAGRNPKSLTVYVSHDDGGTWRKLAVRKGRITVENPGRGGSVSFRAEVRDDRGNALSQTIIGAYRTR
ncbi:S8 family serine peptidase [Streptomyces taklimakanensis]|uniref:S8 family serine peptidase n=1 Tax=Streptomyces taklimakanensis TaxID=2569853 RepID=UPI0030840E88